MNTVRNVIVWDIQKFLLKNLSKYVMNYLDYIFIILTFDGMDFIF